MVEHMPLMRAILEDDAEKKERKVEAMLVISAGPPYAMGTQS